METITEREREVNFKFITMDLQQALIHLRDVETMLKPLVSDDIYNTLFDTARLAIENVKTTVEALRSGVKS